MKEEKKKKRFSRLGIVLAVVAILILIAYANGNIRINKDDGIIYHAPEVKYAYSSYLNSPNGTIVLVAGVEDADSQFLNVQFWIRDNNSANWTGIGNFEGIKGEYSVDTAYRCVEPFDILNGKIAYWKVTVTDGNSVDSLESSFKYNLRI